MDETGRSDPDAVSGVTRFPLGRRALVGSGLMSGFTLATTRVDAQAIHTDAAGLVAGEVQVAVTDGHIPAYFARPAGEGPFPIVLVNEEVFGVHEYIRDICRRLAHAGYLAIAPEIYARSGDISKITDSAALFRDVILRTPDAQVMADLDAAVAWAAANRGDPARLATTGFCRGGRTVWLYDAHNPKLKAAVAWYGPVGGPVSAIQPRTATDVAAEIHAPLLGLYGGQDGSIPVAAVEAAAARARAAGKVVEIVVFPDAPHGFHADYRPSYRAADAAEGWRRMLAWFHAHGVG